MNQNPNEVLLDVQERFANLGIGPDETIYRICAADVFSVIAEKLVSQGGSIDDLASEDLQAMYEKAKDYLEGEGMPWHEIASLGVSEAYQSGQEATSKDEVNENWYFDAEGALGLGIETFGPYNSLEEAYQGIERLRTGGYKNFSAPVDE